MLDAIHSLYLAAADLEAASRPYQRLGLQPSADRRHVSVAGIRLELVAPDSAVAAIYGTSPPARALLAVGIAVADLGARIRQFADRGIADVRLVPGQRAAWLPLFEHAGADLLLVEEPVSPRGRTSSFPLKRLDHLAIVAPDLHEKSRFWSDTLGVPRSGEVMTSTMVIFQHRIGDAVVELLAPASAESPLRERPPGLVGMASWEVDNLAAAVAQAKSAGFTPNDPAPGPLPGTRIATIQGTELAGLNMQLLEYVGK
jgi:catechol 2,3-dioxygenase-like lactoylglutathione lyase family enzyme